MLVVKRALRRPDSHRPEVASHGERLDLDVLRRKPSFTANIEHDATEGVVLVISRVARHVLVAELLLNSVQLKDSIDRRHPTFVQLQQQDAASELLLRRIGLVPSRIDETLSCAVLWSPEYQKKPVQGAYNPRPEGG